MNVSHWTMVMKIDKYQDDNTGDEYTRYSWIVQGDKGAIEFHFKTKPGMSDHDYKHCQIIEGYGAVVSEGIEYHTPGVKGKAVRSDCNILCGCCDNDGSSIPATELIDDMNWEIDKAHIYKVLDALYEAHYINKD